MFERISEQTSVIVSWVMNSFPILFSLFHATVLCLLSFLFFLLVPLLSVFSGSDNTDLVFLLQLP